MRSTSIRIMIIEDDLILRKSYETLINEVEDYQVVSTYPSFDEAKVHLQDDMPDVILLDIELPGLSGIEAIPIIKKIIPQAQIIMLTVYESEDQIFKALTSGASGYLVKSTPILKITESISEVVQGGGPMSATVARVVIKSFQRNDYSPLSRRETQVLEMVSDGKNRKQISNELFIDTETVKTHLKNIYAKLHVNSRADAIKTARQNKLI